MNGLGLITSEPNAKGIRMRHRAHVRTQAASHVRVWTQERLGDFTTFVDPATALAPKGGRALGSTKNRRDVVESICPPVN